MKKKLLFTISILTLIMLCSALTIVALSSTVKNEGGEDVIISSEEFFTDSALFTHKDDETVYVQGAVNLEGFEQKIENSNLVLYSNKKTGAIRILNKNTGYYWCSDSLNIDEENDSNVIKKKLRSSFRLVYRDKDSKVKEIYTADAGVNLTETVSNNKLTVKIYQNSSKIGFSYEITLNSSSINVKIKNDSILEDGDNKITSLSLFPYFGSVYQDDIPGYIFLPSGSGALIRYSKTSPITSSIISNFYGVDANITKNSETDSLSLPVYGVVHGVKQNAMFANIKSGSTFANLTFSPANLDQGYNMVYPSFNYRETYLLQIPGSDQILMVPEDYYTEDVEIEYTFLSGDNATYVGMAKEYQKELIAEGVLEKTNLNKENISLQIEAFGRDYEKGLIFKKYKNMTTTKDILSFNARLSEAGINDVFYVLRAFNKGGYSNQSASSYKFDGALGSLKDLKDLETYFYYNPVESYNSKKNYPKNTLVNLYNEKNYILVEKDKYKFYSNVKTIEKYTNKALSYYESKDVSGVALDGIGYRLYGDKNAKLSRGEVKDILTSLLDGKKVAMFTPNSYFLGSTSKYLNMPLYSARYRFVTDSVPFLEIVLKGYIDYYSPYLNFSSNIDLDVLKCIEFGVSPAYLVTDKESYNLSNTLSSNYYATYYETVEEIIKSNYKYINDALKQVIGSEIENREIIEEGISVVSYSNGKKIIVNYTNDPYNYEGALVSARSYLVK
ncbi:MAG: hypothetical protein J5666_02805 [Bacilli bacterium]|nr:hypothetical protein [Bacilli bacterium]